VATYSVDAATSKITSVGVDTYLIDPIVRTYQYATIPYQEFTQDGVVGQYIIEDAGNLVSFRAQQGRLITSKARFMFCGSDFANGGSVAVARQCIRAAPAANKQGSDTLAPALYGTNRMVLSSQGPATFNEIMSLEGAMLLSASETKCGYDVINVPYSYGYLPRQRDAAMMYYSGAATPVPSFGLLSQTTANPAGTGGLALSSPSLYDAPSTFIAYEGLADEATVTITSQTCIEYAVDFMSPVARFATSGPPLDRTATDTVAALARQLPATKGAGESWFGRTMSWFGDVAGTAFKASTGMAAKAMLGINPWDLIGAVGSSMGPSFSKMNRAGQYRSVMNTGMHDMSLD
jgi:hypothetical protein